MCTEFKVSELKIGDRVGYYKSHYGTLITKGFGTVTKTNGYGHVHVKVDDQDRTIVFDKGGSEYKVEHRPISLCSIEWLQREIDGAAADQNKQSAVRLLLNAIANHRCGNGRYNITDETKAELHLLVDAI